VPAPIYVVDAFTDRPFAGNPAAVCLLSKWLSDDVLQAIAREMNLSETAFLVKQRDAYELRWFTPGIEVDLCGHATLAAACVLWTTDREPNETALRFLTRSGELSARGAGESIELDFPLEPDQPAQPPSGLIEALKTEPRYVGRNRFDYLVELGSESELRAIDPDFQLLATIPCRGIIITARANEPEYDFVSRFFAPAACINEDPVTGSAHCCLVAFWQKRLGRNDFVAYQASQRGGTVRVRVRADRAILGGQAVIISAGELLVV
jgi:predicted PhzF superfamily epimerase YddE/YHI9